MKTKLQLDAKTIQEFLIQNVEKIGLAAAALIFLLMVYSALNKVDRYDRTPEELIQAVKQGENTLEQTPAKSDLKVQDYAARAIRSRIPIKEKEYVTPVVWDPPLFPTRPLRGDPPLLAAQQLRGKADVGPFQLIVPAPQEDANLHPQDIGRPIEAQSGMVNEVRGQRWIVLTALVPIEKQEIAYHEAFSNSKYPDPQNDVPKYLGYWVQRVEVPGPSEAAEIDWEKAQKIQSSTAMKEAMSKWAQSGGTEVVEQKYLHQRLVFPLGTLVDRQWDESVAHRPEVPIISTGATGMAGGILGGGRPMLDDFAGGGGMRPGRGRRIGPEEFAGPGGAPDAEDDPFSPEENNPLGAGPADAETIAELNKPPAHLLLRFFDFNVAPGKHYVYRVRLGLQNPNRYINPAYLKDPKLAEQKWLETKWSDPSPVIFVPRETRVLAVSVKPGRANRDPSGRVMVAKWVQRRGFEAFDEFPVQRGQVVSFPDKIFPPVEAGTRTPAPPGRMDNRLNRRGGLADLPGLERNRGRNLRGRPDLRNPEMPFPDMGQAPAPGPAGGGKTWLVNYYSRAIAIDFRGGQRLSGRRGTGLTALGEILLLDADGKLIVRNELDDISEREKLAAAAKVAAPPMDGLPFEGAVPNVPRADGPLDKLLMPNSGRRSPWSR